MADAPREIELKFALPVARVAELAAAIPELARAEPVRLVSTYYDTAKGALRRAGIALRVRQSGEGAGERFIQTVKDAGDGVMSRGEWEAPVKGPKPNLAKLRATPAGPLLPKGAALAARYAIEVRRRTADIVEGESRIELSLDEGAARARGGQAPFAELELELKGGPRWGLFALARRLLGAGDLTLSFTTKAARGSALARQPRSFAQKFHVPALPAKTGCVEAFQAVAKACLVQIAGNAERLRRRPSPEVVHQTRVGIRRLRSLITTFKDVVTDARLPAIKAELKWLTGELDAARNLDVLLHGDYRAALAQKEVAEGLKGLGTRLRGARRIAYARAATAVESERFRKLLLDLLIWIEAGPWTGAESRAKARRRPVERFAENALGKRRRKIVRRARHLADLDAHARHKLRIDAKKLRYSADVFAGMFDRPKRAKAFIAALKDVQEMLGQLNDIVVGERLAQEVATGQGRAEPDAAFVAGRISGAQKARTEPLLDEAKAALAAFKDAKPFWE